MKTRSIKAKKPLTENKTRWKNLRFGLLEWRCDLLTKLEETMIQNW